MTNGGKRPGAGRKPGSKLLSLQALLEAKGKADHKDADHYINEYLDFLLANYMEEPKLMIWMGDHLWGKAPQAITGPNGEPLVITFDNAFTHQAEGGRRE